MQWLIVLIVLLTVPPSLWAQKYKLGEPDSGDRPITEEEKVLVENVVEEFYQKGKIALKAGKLEQAETYFDRVLILNPNHRDAQEGINLIMRLYEEPEPQNKEIVSKKDPKKTLVTKLLNQLNQAFKKNKFEEAETLAKKIIAIDPTNAVAKKRLGEVHRKMYVKMMVSGARHEKSNQLQRAIDAYQNALSYKNDSSLKQKIKTLRKQLVLKRRKRSDELYIEALSASQSGNYRKALGLCQKALSLNPKNLQAKRMAERLESRPLQ